MFCFCLCYLIRKMNSVTFARNLIVTDPNVVRDKDCATFIKCFSILWLGCEKGARTAGCDCVLHAVAC